VPFRLILLSALLALTACSHYDPPELAEAAAHPSAYLRPGYAVVESVGVLPSGRRDPGGAAPGDPNAYRLFLRMENGGFQTVDVDNPSFMAGQYVEITSDGRVVRVSGTSIDRLK
jgi:hypothetical protein